MANLSLAAQVVLDVAQEHTDFDSCYAHFIAAAALRAAVHQIHYQDQLGLTAYGGHAQAQDQLLAIANELENI
jgi:hypothetical protein